ncbi:hypothetical protein ACFYY8_17425 [Streptosporangium sp. NPDC001559]
MNTDINRRGTATLDTALHSLRPEEFWSTEPFLLTNDLANDPGDGQADE